MKTFFYSDPHFGHARVIEYCNRPFTDKEDQTEGLIARYNSVVGKDDLVIWCGDTFFMGTQKATAIMQRLNGRKILILGNHDQRANKMMKLGFEWACREMLMYIAGTPVRISHYPYAPPFWKRWFMSAKELRYLHRRPKRDRREFLIHGHTHSKSKFNDRMMHAGVDSWDYYPVPVVEFEKYIQQYKG